MRHIKMVIVDLTMRNVWKFLIFRPGWEDMVSMVEELEFLRWIALQFGKKERIHF